MGKTNKKILILSPLFGTSGVYYAQIIQSIIRKAHIYGYQTLIHPVDVTHKLPLLAYFNPPKEIDGIIAITCQIIESSWIRECLEYGIPIVLVHDNIDDSHLVNTSVVSSLKPELTGLKELTRHLVRDHHVHNISIVMVDPHNHAIRQAKLRTLIDTITSSGLEFDKSTQLFFVPAYSVDEGSRIADSILRINPKTEAVISLADTTAVGLQKAFEREERNHILITGFDNIDMAEEFNITSVDQQLKVTGERAFMDIMNAIEDRSFQLAGTTYIPTTFIKRGSCCKPPIPDVIKGHPLPRFAVYYNIEDTQVVRAVDRMRIQIYKMQHPLISDASIRFLGKAPLYPLHITLKGIFQIKKKSLLQSFLKEIGDVLHDITPFEITSGELMNYPKPTFLSFGFDDESKRKLADLQNKLIQVIQRYRNNRFVEPEFRKHVYGPSEGYKRNTLEFGEPYIHDLFVPHVSIISGIDNEHDYKITRSRILKQYQKLQPLRLCVDKISVLYETRLGGNWVVLQDYYLGKSNLSSNKPARIGYKQKNSHLTTKRGRDQSQPFRPGPSGRKKGSSKSHQKTLL